MSGIPLQFPYPRSARERAPCWLPAARDLGARARTQGSYKAVAWYTQGSYNSVAKYSTANQPKTIAAIGSWRLRSGSAHCDLALAVGLR